MNSKTILSLVIALSIGCPILSVANTLPTSISMNQAQAEGKILGTLIVLNKNEIAAANLAMKKTSNSQVKSFAALMMKQHSDNLKKTELLSHKLGIKISEGKVAMKLEAQGKKDLRHLNKLQGSSFDKAYMSAMVKGHQAALNLVNDLISKSSNPLIKKHLEATKTHVAYHLQKAQEVEKSVQ